MSRDNIVNKAGSSSGDPPSLQANPKEKREFQSGDKVRITKRECGHKYEIGDVTYLVGEKPFPYGQWATNKRDPKGNPEDTGYVRTTEIELVSEDPQIVKHTAYVKFPDYHKTYAYILPDSIYEKIRGYKDVKLQVPVTRETRTGSKQEIKVVHLVDVKVNYVDPVATKEIVGVESVRLEGTIICKDIELTVSSQKNQGSPENIVKAHSHVHGIIRDTITTKPFDEIYNEWKSKQPNQFLNNKEETNMSNINRRIVNIEVVDQDSALDVEDSLVIIKKEVVTQDSDEVTIREWLSTGELKEALEAHNKKRTDRVNRDILNRTGNKVYLEAIKVKDLTIRVV